MNAPTVEARELDENEACEMLELLTSRFWSSALVLGAFPVRSFEPISARCSRYAILLPHPTHGGFCVPLPCDDLLLALASDDTTVRDAHRLLATAAE